MTAGRPAAVCRIAYPCKPWPGRCGGERRPMSSQSAGPRVAYFRGRAEKARREAAKMRNPVARMKMLSAAEYWDGLALHASFRPALTRFLEVAPLTVSAPVESGPDASPGFMLRYYFDVREEG